ncbi:MAG: pyrimidine dimer DNA glycosylase/endonuclease V [Candidatus Omnitrophica bacterium]|nr:pyrimidine dimer DNA glycosylase/endonuclease V [Candidatus Omnitrophota bacterium]
MRIWDIPPKYLCRSHLLGEHRELHAVWNILTRKPTRGGYINHPETRRWVGRLKALYRRHEQLVKEMKCRGFKHYSALDQKMAGGLARQDRFINTLAEQTEILRQKRCQCFLEKREDFSDQRYG